MQERKKPQRQCIACRACRDKQDLIRVVKTKEGEIMLDRTGRKNGRGAYLCANEECLKKAWKSNALSRSFRMNVKEETYLLLERQIRKVLGSLGLAMKAGDVVSGEFMTEKAIREGIARLVIVAKDASGNTKKKFADSCHFYHVPYVEFGDKEMLGKAIGKEFRASVAVTNSGFAKAIGKNLDLEVTKYGKNENI